MQINRYKIYGCILYAALYHCQYALVFVDWNCTVFGVHGCKKHNWADICSRDSSRTNGYFHHRISVTSIAKIYIQMVSLEIISHSLGSYRYKCMKITRRKYLTIWQAPVRVQIAAGLRLPRSSHRIFLLLFKHIFHSCSFTTTVALVINTCFTNY